MCWVVLRSLSVQGCCLWGVLLAVTMEQRTAVCHHEMMVSLKNHQRGSSVVEEACDPST